MAVQLLEENNNVSYRILKELDMVNLNSPPCVDFPRDDIDQLKRKATSFFDGLSATLRTISTLTDMDRALELLANERMMFEDKFEKAYESGQPSALILNRYSWELLVEAHVWKTRIECDNVQEWEEYSVTRDDFLRSGLTPGVSHLSGLPSDVEEFIAVEARKLHIVIKDGIVVRDYKDEVSSLIACVMAHGRTIERGSGWPEVMAEPALGCSECVGLKFGDDSVVSVATLHEERFKELRRRAHLAELEYITSLSRCARWDAKGGKSNAVFAKTRDEKLIVKEIQKVEFNSFNWFAEKYIEYMLEGRPGCLAKIFGLYKVKGVGRTRYLIVMENIQFGRQFSRRYDVKGLVYKRSANEDSDEVLLDENFARLMTSCRVSKDTKDKLTIAVKNDADFLTSVGVMDYSLLIGVNKEEFAYGIIDYLRQYTFDKGLETIFKFVCVVPWGQRPTIIPPAKYSSRLQCFLSDHFRTT